ncbi:MAG: Smr/MutS family protein [Bacteroidales bacterium]|nr:Smr/MutS family protein [Bacteroidales bacterium]
MLEIDVFMVYPDEFEKKIGFDTIREVIHNNCLSTLGQGILEKSSFLTDKELLKVEISRVAEFQRLVSEGENFPVDHYYDLSACLNKIRVEGSHPETFDIFNLRRSLLTLKSIFNFIKQKNSDKIIYPALETVTSSIRIFPYVLDTIDRILSKEGVIKDKASPELASLRSEMKKLSVSVSRKLHSVLKQSQSDGFVEQGVSIAIRNGRGVIPVGAYDKNKISGLIHDQSATGKTVYIEPEEVVAMNNRLVELEYDEKREIIKILVVFADNIRPYIDDLLANYGILGEIDYIRARAMLGIRLSSVAPIITFDGEMEWVSAVHPLLKMAFAASGERKVVPLNINLNKEERILLISGPNAGGKSVCLKTVGLLQYMFQRGLTVPVKEESRFTMFNNIFIDIGDEQSIENDLSTYSSHLHNMKYFLKHSDSSSLVLIDEFGTGTEPMLGAAIAEAILTSLNKTGLYGVLTTHYTNLKHFASSVEGIVNGAMMFDNHLMKPLFRLEMGKPGSSFAFEIARKIGLPEDVLLDASGKVGEDHINFDKHLKDILRDKRYWDKKRQNIRMGSKRLDELVEDYEKEISGLKSERKEIIALAKVDAKILIDDANKKIERTIKEIKEAQAEKEKTRTARSKLAEVEEKILADPEVDKRIEAKIKKLKEKELRVKENKDIRKVSLGQTQGKQAQGSGKVVELQGPIKVGDKVRMDGVSAPGEVTSVDGKKAIVLIGNMLTNVSVDSLSRISSSEYKKETRSTSNVSLDWEITKRKSRFNPDIDVRGMRADEALETVRTLVDEAIMVQYANLRILHGKGNGILRQLIREYLSSVDLVQNFRDENIEAGGTGITLVKIDV